MENSKENNNFHRPAWAKEAIDTVGSSYTAIIDGLLNVQYLQYLLIFMETENFYQKNFLKRLYQSVPPITVGVSVALATSVTILLVLIPIIIP